MQTNFLLYLSKLEMNFFYLYNLTGPCSYSSAAQSGLEERDDSFDGAVAAAAGNQVELCPYAAHGQCRFAERCPYVHGEVCDLCFRPLLVPNDQLQNEQHRKVRVGISMTYTK